MSGDRLQQLARDIEHLEGRVASCHPDDLDHVLRLLDQARAEHAGLVRASLLESLGPGATPQDAAIKFASLFKDART